MSDSEPTPQLEVEVLSTSDGNSDIQVAKPVIPDTGYLPLQNYMGIDNPKDDQKEKMQYVWDVFGKGRDRAGTLEAIKDVRHRLSPPEMGETYLTKLWSYARLVDDGRSIEREKKAYESQ